MVETWRAAPGYVGLYEVSDLGRVRRIGKASGAKVGRVLKHHIVKKHAYVTLSVSSVGRELPVHALIAWAFIGGPPGPGYEINHIDLDPLNNVPSNLEWTTHAENVTHAWRNGHGGGLAKLSADTVLAIYQAKGTRPASVVASDYDVSDGTIRGIWKGRTWAWITHAK